MSDFESVQSASDPLPDRLKQYLSDAARRELETLRASIESRLLALEAALAHPEPHESIDALVMDLARATAAEAEASAAQRVFDAQLKAYESASSAMSAKVAQAEHALEDERRTSAALRNDVTTLKGEMDRVRAAADRGLKQERAAAKQARDKVTALQREVADAKRAADSHASAFEAERGAATAAHAVMTSRMTALEEERGQLEQALRAADARADETARQRDALAAELETAKQHAAHERDQLNQRAAADRGRLAGYETQLVSVDEQIRKLELQLFRRDRPAEKEKAGGEKDEDLSELLDRPEPGPAPIRAASRYAFRGRAPVNFNGEGGVLVDLSTSGAQVLTAHALDQDREGVLTLQSDEHAVACPGKVVWTRLDPNSQGKSLRYRAGIHFGAVDAAAIEAFIIRYSAT